MCIKDKGSLAIDIRQRWHGICRSKTRAALYVRSDEVRMVLLEELLDPGDVRSNNRLDLDTLNNYNLDYLKNTLQIRLAFQ